MDPLRIYRIDAFTTQQGQGNAAGVVTNAAGLDEAAMQAIAHQLGHSETAFVLPPDAGDHDLHIRYFTPTTEVPVCGHTTVGAHFALALEGATPGVRRQLTGAGVQTVTTVRRDDGYSHGRMFAPGIGVDEDPVTGNANGPLGAYLVRHKLIAVDADEVRFRGRQQTGAGRGGFVDVSVQVESGEPVGVAIEGLAVLGERVQ